MLLVSCGTWGVPGTGELLLSLYLILLCLNLSWALDAKIWTTVQYFGCWIRLEMVLELSCALGCSLRTIFPFSLLHSVPGICYGEDLSPTDFMSIWCPSLVHRALCNFHTCCRTCSLECIYSQMTSGSHSSESQQFIQNLAFIYFWSALYWSRLLVCFINVKVCKLRCNFFVDIGTHWHVWYG